MAGLEEIQTALESALAAMMPALATEYSNMTLAPVIGTPWQRATLLPAEPANPEIGGALVQEVGIFQISLFYPIGFGSADALARAQMIRSVFKRASAFTSNGVTVTVERTPEIGPALIEKDWYHLPVRIRYFSNYQG
jgi:hypothetical protein